MFSQNTVAATSSVVSWLEAQKKNLETPKTVKAKTVTADSWGFDEDFYPAKYTYYASSIDFVNTVIPNATPATIEARNKRLQNAFHFAFSRELFSGLLAKTKVVLDAKSVDVAVKAFPSRLNSQRSVADFQSIFKPLEKKIEDYVVQQETALVKRLIDAYTDKDEALRDALLVKDANGNSPLHVLIWEATRWEPVELIFTRIRSMPPAYKERILLDGGGKGRTIVHMLAYRGAVAGGFDQLQIVFGAEVLKKAFNFHFDARSNTPLHSACISQFDRFKKIEFICDQLVTPPSVSSGTVEVKPSLAILFQQNVDGQNPIHRICNNSSESESNLKIIEKFKTVLGPDYIRKLKEPDAKGVTPLHSATARANVSFVRKLLEGLSPAEKKELASIGDAKGETPLHYACRFGTPALLEEIVLAMGPAEFFCQRKTTDLLKLIKTNLNKLSPADFVSLVASQNSIFDCIDYFMAQRKRTDKDFESRLQDFYTTVVRPLEADEHLGACRAEFKSQPLIGKITLFQTERYYAARSKVKLATLAELKEAQDLLANPSDLDCTRLGLTREDCKALHSRLFTPPAVAKAVPVVPDVVSAATVPPPPYPGGSSALTMGRR